MGVFETNSSSTHSVSIESGTLDKPAKLDIGFGEYGWGYDVFTDPTNKASYLYTAIYNYVPESMPLLLERLDKTGVPYTLQTPVEHYNNGYIDHQSSDCEWVPDVLGSQKAFELFLFCRNSEVVIDNDNH